MGETALSQDYRAFWTTSATIGWTNDVVSQASGWLAPKFDGDVDLTVDGVTRGTQNRLEVRHHVHSGERALRFVMEEENKGGFFVTTLTAVEGRRGEGWLSLDVVHRAGGFVNRPNLAGRLLDVVDFGDGTRLDAEPGRIGIARVDEVVAALTSPTRRGAVLVAGTDSSMDFDAFAKAVGVWTREVVGLAHVYVLDPLATEDLNARLGRHWAAPPWAIRTYLPSIDISTPVGARENRILGTARLGGERDRYLARLLGGVARGVILDRPAPAPWRGWQRIFERISTDALVESVVVRPPRVRRVAPPAVVAERPDLAPDVARLEAELERVRTTLELIDLTEDSLMDLLDQATSERVDPESVRRLDEQVQRQRERAERVEARLDESQARLVELHQMVQAAESARDEFERRARYLTKVLVENNLHELAYGEVPDDSQPDYGPDPATFEELVERMTGLEYRGVVFTGDPKCALELQEIDADGKALASAWDAVVSLCEYVRAKNEVGYDGSVSAFLAAQPAGYQLIGPNQHASTETGYTKKQYKNTRRFPVPTEVHKSGEVDMYEHFKLARIDHQDPRMHYYDHTAKTGKVYVGYLGVHLVNSKT